MPIYDYVCMSCESHFEELVGMSDPDPTCPDCGNAKVAKQFSKAFAAAAYYAFSVPQQRAHDVLSARLRDLRLAGGGRTRGPGDLVRRDRRGVLAPLGDFVTWIAGLARLQQYIDQANLKYRATEVFALSVIIAISVYLLLMFAGLSLLILRTGLALAAGSIPILYIRIVRNRRMHKFEEALPE